MAGSLRLRQVAALLMAAPAFVAGVTSCGSNVAAPLATNPLPSASTSPPPAGHRFGETVAAGSGFVLAAAFNFTQPAAPSAAPAQPGHAWAAADVQACAQPGTVFQVTVSDGPWSVRYSDGTAVQPSHADDAQFPQPRYPGTPTSLHPGECLRGWVMFEVPANGEPQVLRYAPQGAPPIDWLIP